MMKLNLNDLILLDYMSHTVMLTLNAMVENLNDALSSVSSSVTPKKKWTTRASPG